MALVISDSYISAFTYINRDSGSEFKVIEVANERNQIRLESTTGKKCSVNIPLDRFKSNLKTTGSPWSKKK